MSEQHRQDEQNGQRGEWLVEVGEDGTPWQAFKSEDGRTELVGVLLSDVKIEDAPAEQSPKTYYMEPDEPDEEDEEDEEWDGESGLRGYLEHAGWNPIMTARSLKGVWTGRAWGVGHYVDWFDTYHVSGLENGKQSSYRWFRPQPAPLYPPSMLVEIASLGVADDITGRVAQQSEADPMAILVQFLSAFGSYVGRRAYFPAERDRHYPNLFAVLVGEAARGRKGTSWGQAVRVFEGLSPATDAWLANCVTSGLSSGEGVIHALRDRRSAGGGNGILAIGDDALPADRRLLVRESEFASVLKMFQREGNTLSAVLRQALDGATLKVITKHSSEQASGAHISVIGHITREELTRNLSQTEVANGLGNRFLWLCVRRSKLLPEGGDESQIDLSSAREWLREVVEWVETLHDAPLRRDRRAAELWRDVYADLSKGEPVLAGALLARVEAQVMRVASIYALLHRTLEIDYHALTAALALWEYCELSTRYIFGQSYGDGVSDTILSALRQASGRLTRTQIGALFGKTLPGARITEALNALEAHGKITSTFAPTGGRPAEVWQALDAHGNPPGGQSW